MEKAVSNLAHLEELYKEGDVKRERVIIGSIYPEKLTFDGFRYRTTRVNEAVELIYALDLGFSQNETGQTKEVFDLSSVLPDQDSNLDKQNQNLSYYHYTIGQSVLSSKRSAKIRRAGPCSKRFYILFKNAQPAYQNRSLLGV